MGTLLLLSFLLILLTMLAVSIGALRGRLPPKGSCGGMTAVPGITCIARCKNPCKYRTKPEDP